MPKAGFHPAIAPVFQITGQSDLGPVTLSKTIFDTHNILAVTWTLGILIDSQQIYFARKRGKPVSQASLLEKDEASFELTKYPTIQNFSPPNFSFTRRPHLNITSVPISIILSLFHALS
ncbi:MAG: hypothetical protein LV481_15680 [Methylacidiphilales bacterium]|nr:hypothetical protein [Candidatus Methylacidiphilales bacterium]